MKWLQSRQLWQWGLGAVVGAVFLGLYTGMIPNPQTAELEAIRARVSRLTWAVIRLCRQHERTAAGRAECERRVGP